ncbi:MAG: hypothetical protein J0I07_09595 [Myxococcales bacterium]|nr:hypothetical protein [Myxococcales bacterium]
MVIETPSTPELGAQSPPGASVAPEPRASVVDEARAETIRERRHARLTRGVSTGGSAAEALLGLAAVVLSILALAGMRVLPLTAFAVIAVGVALFFESASVAARSGFEGTGAVRSVVLGGTGAETIAAIAAIALGVLAALGIEPLLLLPTAILVLGVGLLFSGALALVERIRSAIMRAEPDVSDVTSGLAGLHMLVGAGALVLGVLGLISGAPILLTVIGTLSIGTAVLLSGAALGGSTTPVKHAMT